MTEKLAQLLAMSNIKESTFVLWNTRHRITLASPISQSPHLVKNNVPESLKLVTVYKRYIPFLISWYGLLEDQYSIIAIKKSSHQSVALKKYMIYDGHRILPWGGADGGKVKRELFDKKFTSSLEAESGYRYKRTKYIQDITAAIHNPKYMRDWVKKPQVRYKMMYKTLHFLARSGIDPLLFAKATGSFSDSIKKQIIKRAQQDPSDQMTKFIVYRGNRIMLTRDVVGLWTVDHYTKNQFLKDIDCIQAFDIEHVVSNSYGADNSDPLNGVLLDCRINRSKGSTMLFLITEDLVKGIQVQKRDQDRWLVGLLPWWKRWLF